MNVGIIFGGKSVEHDISILTAVEAMGHMNIKHTLYPVYIDRQNRWFTTPEYRNLKAFTQKNYAFKYRRACTLFSGDSTLYELKKGKYRKIAQIDCFVNACHGGLGENGGLAAILDAAEIPFAGCGVLPSALGMNKYFFKQQLKAMDISTLSSICIDSQQAAENLSVDYPVIVKPASLGSSIGISKAENQDSLKLAVASALRYDSEVIIEPLLRDFTEINCAAVRYGGEILLSECEQPITDGDFLSFADKYISGEKFRGQVNAERIFPAVISDRLRAEIRSITSRIYGELRMSGVVRVDFMVYGENVYVNEINTVPGSLSNYLFEPMEYTKLLDILIEQAVSESAKKRQKIYAFDSCVLGDGNKKTIQK